VRTISEGHKDDAVILLEGLNVTVLVVLSTIDLANPNKQSERNAIKPGNKEKKRQHEA
jgi:hypothetical protein